MSEKNAKWYIVKCPTGVELKFIHEFKEALEKQKTQDLLEDYFIPLISQQKVTNRRAIMANYLFVKIVHSENIDTIITRLKYASLMRDQSLNLVVVDEETIQNLKNKDQEEKERLDSKLGPGELVRILEAPFLDFEGKIEKIDEEKQIAAVTVTILGNPISIELPFTAIKRIINE